MNHTGLGELETLIAKLCDGRLTADEARRLNELLKADPIAQESYLDHFLIHGLLEREFAAALPPSLPAPGQDCSDLPALTNRYTTAAKGVRQRRLSRRRLVAMCLLLFAGGALIRHFWEWPLQDSTDAPAGRPVLLAYSGFESGFAAASGPLTISRWHGDHGEIVEQHGGATALEGNKMYRFIKSTGGIDNACDLYQIVDLEPLAETAAGAESHLEATAFFNAATAELEQYTFELSLFAFQDDRLSLPVEDLLERPPVASSECQVQADRDLFTWQKVTARIPLPRDARRLVVKLSVARTASENGEELPGAFADHISLHLVGSP